MLSLSISSTFRPALTSTSFVSISQYASFSFPSVPPYLVISIVKALNKYAKEYTVKKQHPIAVMEFCEYLLVLVETLGYMASGQPSKIISMAPPTYVDNMSSYRFDQITSVLQFTNHFLFNIEESPHPRPWKANWSYIFTMDGQNFYYNMGDINTTDAQYKSEIYICNRCSENFENLGGWLPDKLYGACSVIIN